MKSAIWLQWIKPTQLTGNTRGEPDPPLSQIMPTDYWGGNKEMEITTNRVIDRITFYSNAFSLSYCLKGIVQQDFRPLFFSLFESAYATDQWVKIFLIFVQISLSYSNFRLKKTDSLGCDTPGRLTRRCMIHRGRGVMFWRIFYWLPGVWYSGEIDSPGYHTLGRMTRHRYLKRHLGILAKNFVF